ncbi:MAG: DUF4124 domain-containing protein [Gammaproteobacteria bacterium]
MMRQLLGITLLLLLISGSVSAGKIYTWKDADGQVHFSAMPPPQVEVEATGLTTGASASEPDRAEADKAKPQRSVDQHKKGQKPQPQQIPVRPVSPATIDPRQQSPRQPIKIDDKYRVNNAWKKEVIDKCKANRGVDCDNPRYVQSKRPLSEDERNQLNRDRQERRAREAMQRSDAFCRGGRC